MISHKPRLPARGHPLIGEASGVNAQESYSNFTYQFHITNPMNIYMYSSSSFHKSSKTDHHGNSWLLNFANNPSSLPKTN